MLFDKKNKKTVKIVWAVMGVLVALSMVLLSVVPLFSHF